MSHYTYAILICNREYERVAELNSILRACEVPTFNALGQNGIKDIYVMDDNYLDVWTVENAINSIQWDDPSSVQLLICDEDDDKYSDVKLIPKGVHLSQVFETSGDHDQNGALAGRYRIVNDRAKPAVEVAKDVFGVVSKLTVGAIVSSRVSAGCLSEFVFRLYDDDRKALMSLVDSIDNDLAKSIKAGDTQPWSR